MLLHPARTQGVWVLRGEKLGNFKRRRHFKCGGVCGQKEKNNYDCPKNDRKTASLRKEKGRGKNSLTRQNGKLK